MFLFLNKNSRPILRFSITPGFWKNGSKKKIKESKASFQLSKELEDLEAKDLINTMKLSIQMELLNGLVDINYSNII